MIRQPISRSWRIGLGIAAILLLMLCYTILSQSRQNTARREQHTVAGKRLTQLAEQQQQLDLQRAKAEAVTAEQPRQRALDRLREQQLKLDKDLLKWRQIEREPNAADRTVPTWGMLIMEGLIRACTPQGDFERKETWILVDFKATAWRLLTGLLLGLAISVFLGILMGCFDPAEAFFLPPFSFFSKVPATAVLPIFL